MRNKKGQFVKGRRSSKSTEFKKGQHWREPKPHWEKDWLYHQYVTLEKSSSEIAHEQGCTEGNIFYFLKKHQIPRRTVSEARAIKHWGLSGEQNGMYGRYGSESPNWKGGGTPERQAFYSSQEWGSVIGLVWERDKRTCQRCGKKWSGDKTMHIHHIVSFAVKELRATLSNLILLCAPCHRWVHSNKNTKGEFIRDVG